MFSIVLLPQPDGPTMDTNSPLAMDSETLPTAQVLALSVW